MGPRVIGSLDELRSLVGQQIGQSDWVQITQEMIDQFADVTGDHQWIHVDVERSKREGPFGCTIAHGFLTLSMLSYLKGESIKIDAGQKMTINYGLNRLRFVSPVKAGARIRSRSTLKEVEDVQNGAQVTYSVTIDIEGSEKPALVAETLGRLYW